MFAKFENPDCPKAGADPPAAAQGDVRIPSCEDAPKVLGLPKDGVDGVAAAAFPKEGWPKVDPPVCAAPALELGAPQGDCLDPSWLEEPNDGAAAGAEGCPKVVPVLDPNAEPVLAAAGTAGADVVLATVKPG